MTRCHQPWSGTLKLWLSAEKRKESGPLCALILPCRMYFGDEIHVVPLIVVRPDLLG